MLFGRIFVALTALIVALAPLSTQARASEPLIVAHGGGNPPPPDMVVTALTGIGTNDARLTATVDAARIIDNCHNFYHIYDKTPEECDAYPADHPMLGRTETASARCIDGSLVDWDGRRLTRSGWWPAGTLWNDDPSPRFVDPVTGDSVRLDTASGGRTLARLWEILCTDAERHYATDVATKPSRGFSAAPIVVPEPARYGSGVYGAWHNGSRMSVDTYAGTIAYTVPRSGMVRTVAPGQVLFTGTFYADGWVDGTAFTFKRGCAPLPYRVSGEMFGDGTIVLRGIAQRRDPNSCRSLGLNPNSPHGELVFTPIR